MYTCFLKYPAYISGSLYQLYNYTVINNHLLTPPLREPHADAVWSVTDGEELRNRL